MNEVNLLLWINKWANDRLSSHTVRQLSFLSPFPRPPPLALNKKAAGFIMYRFLRSSFLSSTALPRWRQQHSLMATIVGGPQFQRPSFFGTKLHAPDENINPINASNGSTQENTCKDDDDGLPSREAATKILKEQCQKRNLVLIKSLMHKPWRLALMIHRYDAITSASVAVDRDSIDLDFRRGIVPGQN